MTRQEFSDKLRSFRDKNEVTLKDISNALNVLPADVYRVEKATHCYNVQKAITYANACKAQICVTFPDKTQVIAETPQQIVNLLASERNKRGLSYRNIAKEIDYSFTTISGVESGKNALSIDMLLALADYYALKIDVIPKE